MLIQNLSERLVNGLQGTVRSCTAHTVRVNFPQLNQEVELQKVLFTRHNPLLGKDTATRKQIPLKVSFAMTIHKSQGMSLDFVEVVCSNAFAPGQLGVAIGRAKSTDGLAVFNFNTSQVIPQTKELLDYIDSPSCAIIPDQSCCSQVKQVQELPPCVDVEMPDDDDDDDDDEDNQCINEEVAQDIEELAALTGQDKSSDSDDSSLSSSASKSSHESSNIDLDIEHFELDTVDEEKVPFHIDAVSQLSHQLYETPETPEQIEVNKSVEEVLKKENLQNVVKTVLILIDEMWKKYVDKVSSPKLTAFYSHWHMFVTDKLYVMLPMFSTAGQRECLSKLCVSLREEYVSWLQQNLEQPGPSSAQQMPISKAGEGKIRYLAGRAVVMVRKRCMETIRNTICKQRYRNKYETACTKLEYLDHMRTSVHAVRSGKYSHSLQETERRQNVGGGLTHIKDSLFECFIHLESLRGKLHTVARAKALKGNVLADSVFSVKGDNKLRQLFSIVFDGVIGLKQSIVDLLFDEVVESYMLVANNEFRKLISKELGKKKKLRHRVAILCSSSQMDSSTSQQEKGKGKGRGKGKRVSETTPGGKRVVAETVTSGEQSTVAGIQPQQGRGKRVRAETETSGEPSTVEGTLPKRGRGRGKRVVAETEPSGAPSTVEGTLPKRGRGRGKRVVAETETSGEPSTVEGTRPKRGRGKRVVAESETSAK